MHRINPENMEAYLQHLRRLLADHVEFTGSVWGEAILADFRRVLL